MAHANFPAEMVLTACKRALAMPYDGLHKARRHNDITRIQALCGASMQFGDSVVTLASDDMKYFGSLRDETNEDSNSE